MHASPPHTHAPFFILTTRHDTTRHHREEVGATVLLATLAAHAGNQDIASVGLDVIFALSYDAARGPNPDSHPILLQAGAPEFILRMLHSYPQSPEIYGPGLKAAACLLTSPESQRSGMTGRAWCGIVCEVCVLKIE
jgi:hypothetical protein